MKTYSIRLLVIISLLAASTGLFGQSKSDKIFDNFKNKPGFTYFSFNKDIKDAFNINLDDENKTISGDLHEIKFLSYNPEKGDLSGRGFLKRAIDMLPSAYDKVDLDDDDNNVVVWKLGKKKKISEFHVFIKSDSPDGYHFLISFLGDFDVDDAEGIKEIGVSFSSK
ncbi:DUF4252 domain-containing protein [Sunxiuqinia sp. A32]|uniref:DUF4252 domain-containing protein n=1 Tax=Sunxiuqinia sp. A32 TaxID=3461496 RepID=UPI004046751B